MTNFFTFETLTQEHQQTMLHEARMDALAARISHARPVAAYRIYLARRLRAVAQRIDDADLGMDARVPGAA
jgi:hypothetical protein